MCLYFTLPYFGYSFDHLTYLILPLGTSFDKMYNLKRQNLKFGQFGL